MNNIQQLTARERENTKVQTEKRKKQDELSENWRQQPNIRKKILQKEV